MLNEALSANLTHERWAVALAHLTEIGDYIAKDNQEAAKRFIQAIRSTVEQL